jgi:hypothetical protein
MFNVTCADFAYTTEAQGTLLLILSELPSEISKCVSLRSPGRKMVFWKYLSSCAEEHEMTSIT